MQRFVCFATDMGLIGDGMFGRSYSREIQWLLGLACFVWAGSAVACPVCDSQTAEEVRTGLLGEGLGRTIAAILLPFAVLLAALRAYNVGITNFFRKSP